MVCGENVFKPRSETLPLSTLLSLSLSLSLLVVLNRGTGFRTWNVVYGKERERESLECGTWFKKDLYKEEQALKEAPS